MATGFMTVWLMPSLTRKDSGSLHWREKWLLSEQGFIGLSDTPDPSRVTCCEKTSSMQVQLVEKTHLAFASDK
jgi:hypothetical protein